MKEYIKKNYLILLTILFCEIIFVCFGLPINPDDYWWHVKIGEWIFNNHSVQTTEIYSWAANLYNFSWIDHSWLSELIMYINELIFKNLAPLMFLMISTLITYLSIFKFFNKKNNLFVILYTIFYFILFQKMLAPRPYVLGLMFLVLLIYELEKVKENKKVNFIYLAILFILWTNMHGASALLGILFILYYLIFSLIHINNKFLIINKQSKEQKITYLKILITNIICIFINPYGYKSVFYILSHDKIATQFINEWHSVIEAKSYFIIVLCVISFVLLIKNIKKMEIQNILVIIGLIFLSLYQIRYIMYLIAFVGIYLIPIMNENKKNIERIVRILGIMSILLLVFFITNPQEVTYKKISDDMISTIKQESPQRIYNEYGLGGYLIYKDIPVWWDARADLYRDSILLDSFLAQLNEEKLDEQYNFNHDEFIKKYNFDYILLTKQSKMNDYIKDLGYKIIKEDSQNIFYKKIE